MSQTFSLMINSRSNGIDVMVAFVLKSFSMFFALNLFDSVYLQEFSIEM
jgi:hypothetical protein